MGRQWKVGFLPRDLENGMALSPTGSTSLTLAQLWGRRGQRGLAQGGRESCLRHREGGKGHPQPQLQVHNRLRSEEARRAGWEASWRRRLDLESESTLGCHY